MVTNITSTLKMKAACSFKMLVRVYWTMWHHITDNFHLGDNYFVVCLRYGHDICLCFLFQQQKYKTFR